MIDDDRARLESREHGRHDLAHVSVGPHAEGDQVATLPRRGHQISGDSARAPWPNPWPWLDRG